MNSLLGIRFFCSLFTFIFLGIVHCSAQDATSILDKAAAVYEKSNGVAIQFSMHIRSEQQQVSESFDGTIDIKGDKFVLKTPGMVTWFDGTNQWTYVEQNEEVNLSCPNESEIQVTNPALLLRSYKKGFNVKYKGESTASNGKSCYDISLIPKKKNDIETVELQIEKYSNWPASIMVLTKQGLRSMIRVSQLKTEMNQPDSYFVFDETVFPNVEVIDLR